MTDILARQQQREDTAADWAAVDPVLRAGELAWASDTKKLKIGDGTNPYTALPDWYGTAADILAIVGTPAWTAAQAVTTGDVRQAPDGSWIKSTATRTTGASFDSTERTFWTAVLATSGTIESDALAAIISGSLTTLNTAVADLDTRADALETTSAALVTLTDALETVSDPDFIDALDGRYGTTTTDVDYSTARYPTGSVIIGVPIPTLGGERTSSIVGAGFQNARIHADSSIAAQSALAGFGMTLGDVAGKHATWDYGATYKPVNTGVLQTADQKCVSGALSRVTAGEGIVYISNGAIDVVVGVPQPISGSYSAVHHLTIDPVGKTVVGTKLYDNSTQTALKLCNSDGNFHPRQTGPLTVADPYTPGRYYQGTSDGVITLTLSGASNLIMNGSGTPDFITSLYLDPTSTPGDVRLLATVNGGTHAGVQRITGAGAGQTPALVAVSGAGSPTDPRTVEAVVEAGVFALIVTDGGAGVKKYTGSIGSGSWSNITPPGTTAGTTGNTTNFKSLAVRRRFSDTQTWIMVGHDGQDNTQSKFFLSKDGGATWYSYVDADTDLTVEGLGVPWWLPSKYTYYKNQKSTGGMDSAQLGFWPDKPDICDTVGRSGPWGIDLTLPASSALFLGKWHPKVNGIQTTIAYSVDYDPSDPAGLRAGEGDVDWGAFGSADGFLSSPTMWQEVSGTGTQPLKGDTRMLRFAPDGAVVLAKSARTSGPGGAVLEFNPAPFSGGAWGDTAFLAEYGGTDPTHTGVRGAAITKHPDGDYIGFAFVASTTAGDRGIYRKKRGGSLVGSPAWGSRVSAAGSSSISTGWNRFSIAIGVGPEVWAYHYNQGVYYSNNYGVTFQQIGGPLCTSTYRYAACIAPDPTTPGRAYITVSDGGTGKVWRIDNATMTSLLTTSGGTTVGPVTATDITGPITNPGGARCHTDGTLYVAGGPGATGYGSLWKYAPGGAGTPVDLATSGGNWQSQALFVYDLAISRDGRTVMGACDGNAVSIRTLDVVSTPYEVPTVQTLDAKIAEAELLVGTVINTNRRATGNLTLSTAAGGVPAFVSDTVNQVPYGAGQEWEIEWFVPYEAETTDDVKTCILATSASISSITGKVDGVLQSGATTSQTATVNHLAVVGTGSGATVATGIGTTGNIIAGGLGVGWRCSFRVKVRIVTTAPGTINLQHAKGQNPAGTSTDAFVHSSAYMRAVRIA